jgi:YVTN family beta-propeller protein
MRLRTTLTALLALGFPIPMTPIPSAQAQQSHSGTLLAISKKDHTLSIVDGTTLQTRAKVPTGDDPHEVAASADGLKAWVSNYGFGALHTLRQIDIPTATVDKVIDLGALLGPHGLFVQGGDLWFTAEGAKAIGRYDPAAAKVDLILGTGQDRTHMLHVWPDGKRIATTNVISGTVSLIDLRPAPPPLPTPVGPPPPESGNNWTETIIPVGHGSEGFDISPDNRELWTANAKDGTVSIIDLATRQVTATLPLDIHGANRLKFTPDGRHVLITLIEGHDLVIVDTRTHQREKTIDMGAGSAGIVLDPAGNRAFIACYGGNYIGVLDLHTLQIVAKLDIAEPDGMIYIP